MATGDAAHAGVHYVVARPQPEEGTLTLMLVMPGVRT
jgi:hypothetical protein